jgi:hypothetical protein
MARAMPTPLMPLALVAAVLTGACSNSNNGTIQITEPNPFPGYSSAIYGGTDNWLCHPGLVDADNICASDLDTTRVFANGDTEIVPFNAAAQPEVDCFYVYPTVSADSGGNSDLEEGPEEIFTVLNQAARYSAFCRVFAPVYRQATIAAIFSGAAPEPTLAYGDVLDSFKHYIANHNEGRGFILIGHSQGASHLRRLVAETVEAEDYLLDRMISAHLIGSAVRTPAGADVGGDFQEVPVCRNSDQTGCVVSYATYRDTDPFLAAGRGRFGTPREGALAICSNPAALAGGSAVFEPYFPIAANPRLDAVIIKRAQGPYANPASAPPIATPFYTMPDFIRGECKLDGNGISYLQATALGDPDDPRADDFNGEFIVGDGWGLHLVDMTIALGDLVALGASQAQSWLQDR